MVLRATTNFPTNERRRKGGGTMSAACYPSLLYETRFCETCGAVCQPNFTGFPVRYYFCSRVSIRFTKGTVYAAV